MIRSMTAYAGGERVTPWGTLGCELRSVNHRFLEVGTRLPEELRALEPQLRERIAARLSRGKLDLVMRLRAPEAAANLQVDEALLGQLGRLAHRLTSDFPNLQVSFTDLLQLPGVTRGEATDAAALQAEALALLDQVLEGFVEAREREGGKLSAAISERVDGIERIATEVRTLIPAIRDGQRSKLAARLADLPHPVDPAAPSRNWCCGCRSWTWMKSWTASAATSSRSAVCSSSASRSAAAWTSCCRSSTAKPTRWARSRWTAARPMPRWS